RRDLRPDRSRLAEGRLHLALAEPAQADAAPALDRERPERPRLLALPGAAASGRVPALPRPDEPGQGLPPRGLGRARDRAAAQDRRQEPRAEGARVLRA